MALRYLMISCTLMLLFSCNSNIVEIKNDQGTIIVSYEILPDSTKHGVYKSFFPSGQLQETCIYDNGKLTGERTMFYQNGTPETQENYVAGRIEGPHRTYYENGVLKTSKTYANGTINGILHKYYENGALEEKVTIVDGKEQGPFSEYYENGQLHWEGQYLNGDNEYGLLKEFDENGQLVKKMNCNSLGVCRTIWTLEDGDIIPSS